jgi:excisionase family DNA binding protein
MDGSMKKRRARTRSTRASKATEAPPAPPGLERLLTVGQIARLGARCRASLYEDIKSGKLKAIKFGRSTRITESDWNAYLKAAPTLHSQ